MFGPKVKVSSALMARLTQAAEILGCSSVDEYVERVLAAATDEVLNTSQQKTGDPSKSDVDAIAKKLKGLGYLE